MKKKIVKRTGGTFDFGDFDGKSIKDLVDAVRELEEDYKGQDILFGYDYDASYLSIKIVRDETDEEYAARIKQEDDFNERRRELRRAEYERLKAEFEP